MTQPANTYATNDAVGIREDLSNIIYNIDPTDTPFLTMVKRGTADQNLHEWQTDSLAAGAANAVIEGDDATTDTSSPTTRLTNRTQLMDKVPRVTTRLEASKKAGRGSEMAYQISKKSKELKLDMEFALINQNQAKVAGNDTLASQLASVQSWVKSNASVGTGGANPAGTGADARTDGTQRAFTEDLLKDVLQSCYENGGKPNTIMASAFNRRTASSFTGGSTRFDKAEDKKLTASVSMYVSDWGELSIVPNRNMTPAARGRDVLVIQPDMWSVDYLMPFKIEDLAKTGHTERKMLSVEFTLKANNEASSGIVADLTTS